MKNKRLIVLDRRFQFARTCFAMLLGALVLKDDGRASEVCGNEQPPDVRPKSSIPLLLSANNAA